MQKVTLFLISALILATVSFSGCNKPNPNIDLLYKKWKLVAFVNESDGTNRPPQPDSPNNYWIEFKTDNTLTGVSSTNALTGTFDIRNNSTISISSWGSTDINELFDGELFIESLCSSQHFSVTATELKLFYSDTEYLLFNIYQNETE